MENDMHKKKYKLKKKNFCIFMILFLLVFVFILYKPCSSIFSLMGKDYSFSESYRIYRSGLTDRVLKREYSKTIANVVGSNEYVDENFDYYYSIDFYERDDFFALVNELIDIGYTGADINAINKNYNEVLVSYLSNHYVENISKWLEYDFFKPDKIQRYLDDFDGSYKDTIVRVNIGLDQPYYENVTVVSEYSTDMIINKYHQLDENYVPDNLTLLDHCSQGEHYLSLEAKEAYDKLCQASIEAGLDLSVNSSYRSYQDQEEVYNTYYELYGQNYVDNYVAVSGYSEHHTGLALDVKSLNSNIFANSEEYQWMKENSYKYGFILRYPDDKKDITGCNGEAWHYRYVGLEIAKYIYENDITFDEYYAMFLDK